MRPRLIESDLEAVIIIYFLISAAAVEKVHNRREVCKCGDENKIRQLLFEHK